MKEFRKANKDKLVKSQSDISFPKVDSRETVLTATPRKVYSNAHAYHINSVSVNSDHETFISSDDLRVNLWNLEINDQSFSNKRDLACFFP